MVVVASPSLVGQPDAPYWTAGSCGNLNDLFDQVPDLFKIPSLGNLAAADGTADAASSSPQPQPPGHVPRVTSLDFVRAAFLQGSASARPAGNNSSGGDGAQLLPGLVGELSTNALPPPLPVLMPPLPSLAAVRTEPASSAGSEGVETPCGVAPTALLAALLHGGAGAGGGLSVLPIVAGSSAAAAPFAMVPVPVAEAAPTSTAGAASDTRAAGRSSGAGAGATSGTGKKAAAAGTGKAGGGTAAGEGRPKLSQADKAELRRARRMLSNRESARRSRKRKAEQLGDLESRARDAIEAAEQAQARAQKLAADLAARDAEVASLRRQVHALKRLLPATATAPMEQ